MLLGSLSEIGRTMDTENGLIHHTTPSGKSMIDNNLIFHNDNDSKGTASAVKACNDEKQKTKNTMDLHEI